MKNKVPTDSNLHKEFEDNENSHADMIVEKIELCHKIALLDETFDEEKHTTKEHKNIYATSYETYMTYIKRKFEAKNKETQEGNYQTLLKDLDNLFIDSNTVRANFNSIEKMRNQIPKDSATLEGFEKLQSDYNLFEEKINQVCHQLNSIEKKINQENYTNKETDVIYEGKYQTKYENLLKDLDKVLIDSVLVRANFNAIKMEETASTDSVIFKGFNSLQSDNI